MRLIELIVCESSGAWAAALRVHSIRQPPFVAWKIMEHRSLDDAWRRLSESPNSIVLVEVSPDTFPTILGWTARARRYFPRTQVAALLIGSFAQRSGSHGAGDGREDVAAALFESGVAVILNSRRDLGPLVQLTERHATRTALLPPAGTSLPALAHWAHSSLPWQNRQ